MVRRSIGLVVAVLVIVAGLGAPPAMAADAPAGPVAGLAWFGTGAGPRGMVFLQQQGMSLAVRGLLVGLPASTPAAVRLHAGTCAARGDKVLRVRTTSSASGSGDLLAVLTRPAGTLLALDDGNGAMVMVVARAERRCDDIAVWPKAHRVVPATGLGVRHEPGGGVSPSSESTVSGISFLRQVGGSGIRGMVFVQQNLGSTTDKVLMFAVLGGSNARSRRVSVCSACASPGGTRVLGSVTRTAQTLTTHPVDTLLGYDGTPTQARFGPSNDLLARGPLVIFSLSNDEQLPG